MNQQLQSQVPFHHVSSTSNDPIKHHPLNIHHMYPPVFGQHNMYNGNCQQHLPMYNNNANLQHNYHAQVHNHNHNYGMGYPNQNLISNGNNYWN